jgi:hypothetical protein
VRLDSSSSDSDDGKRRRSSASLGVRALPEKQAIKELGVQARAGGQIERLPAYRRRRRGDYRLEKVKPEVATLTLRYRNSFWFERRAAASASARTADERSMSKPPPAAPAASADAAAASAAPAGASSAPAAASGMVKSEEESKPWWAQPREPASETGAGGARPMARRVPGETGRAPDG